MKLAKKQKISWHNIILAVTFFVIGFWLFPQFIHTVNNQAQEGVVNEDYFNSVAQLVEEKYPFEEPSDQEKTYGAIQGLVLSYNDPYSTFLPPENSSVYNETIYGEFGGIGAELALYRGFVTVISPLKGSPSEKAGLKARDIITHINNEEILGKSFNAVINEIRGEEGSEVSLTVIREGYDEPLVIRITRAQIEVPVIETFIKNDVFVIQLFNFNEKSSNRFEEAIHEFKESGSQKLLIDVRNNPGGYLDAAVDMASYFLPQGDVVLREEIDDDGTEKLYRSKGYKLLDGAEFDLAVLLNGGSASASEILAGALRDGLDARLLGEKSYGKGSVQELISLPENASLKITIARWLTPNKTIIEGVGLEPDIIIKPLENESLEEDSQLEEAINLL